MLTASTYTAEEGFFSIKYNILKPITNFIKNKIKIEFHSKYSSIF